MTYEKNYINRVSACLCFFISNYFIMPHFHLACDVPTKPLDCPFGVRAMTVQQTHDFRSTCCQNNLTASARKPHGLRMKSVKSLRGLCVDCIDSHAISAQHTYGFAPNSHTIQKSPDNRIQCKHIHIRRIATYVA